MSFRSYSSIALIFGVVGALLLSRRNRHAGNLRAATPAPARTPPAAPSRSSSPGRTLRPGVLVVDDDVDAIFLLQRAFARTAPQLPVTYSSNAKRLLEELQTGNETVRPSLLILDLHMPEVDGFQVLQFYQAHPQLRPETITIFSASDHPNDRSRALELGADSYLMKPTGFGELCSITTDIAALAGGRLHPGRSAPHHHRQSRVPLPA